MRKAKRRTPNRRRVALAAIPSYIPVPEFCTVEELEKIVSLKRQNPNTSYSDLIAKVITESIKKEQGVRI